MLKTFASIFLVFSFSGIFYQSQVLKNAEDKFYEKKYMESVKLLEEAKKKYPDLQELIDFNIAQNFYFADSSQQAVYVFEKIAPNIKEKTAKSHAYTQLGNLYVKAEQLEKSLDYYKNALRANERNEVARYNYELIKKKLQQQQNQNQDQQQDDQNQQDQEDDQENQPPPPKNQKNSEKTGQQNQKYDEMPEQMADQLLEGMQQNEKQFYQQLKKSSKKDMGKKKSAW